MEGFLAAATIGMGLALWGITALAQTAPAPRVASEVILAYGQENGLTQQGLEAYLAITRSTARATAILPILKADLDANETLTMAEASVYAQSLSAKARATFWTKIFAADSDLDRQVTPKERADLAQKAALRAVPAKVEQGLADLFQHDLDQDGAVSWLEWQAAEASADQTSDPADPDAEPPGDAAGD